MRGRMYAVIAVCLFYHLACTGSGTGPVNPPANVITDSRLMQDKAALEKLRDKEFREKFEQRYFLPAVSARLEGTGVEHLRGSALPADAKEVRVWAGFDLRPLCGIILTHADGNWSATYLPPSDGKSLNQERPRVMPAPKSGWSSLWARLEGLDIYTLPDAAEIGALNTYFDARFVVIEIKANDSYRNYVYAGLDTAAAPEAQKVLDITKIISEEFGIPLNGV